MAKFHASVFDCLRTGDIQLIGTSFAKDQPAVSGSNIFFSRELVDIAAARSIDMIAATMPKTQSEIVERVMHEHDALRDKVQRIHAVLAEPAPDKAEIDDLLREFSHALVVHFSDEEDKGFFAEITSRAPYLAGAAAKLCIEHRQMLHDAEALCRFAAAGSPSMIWWRELNSRCHAFHTRFMNHECQENRLLHEAHKADIGAYD